MASCQVQETPSQDELKNTENNKNVKNSEERGQLNFKSNNDVGAVAAPSSETDLRPSRSSVTKMTRIPAPTYMGPSGSHYQASSRVYSSVVVRKPKMEDHQLTNDSGIHMDSSMTELPETPLSARPSPILQTILDRIPGTSSEMELRQAEEQTLKELQRVVAEMEADVALDDVDLQDQPLGDDQDQANTEEENYNLTPDVGNSPKNSGLDMEQLSATETQQKQNSVSKEPLTNGEHSVDNLQIMQEECAAKGKYVEDEAAKEEELELFEKLAQDPAPDDPVLTESTEESVDQQPEKSAPESLMEELEMAIGGGCETEEDRILREQFERSPETMGLKFPYPADENMSTISETGLTSCPSLDGSVKSDRRMVPLEELIDPENNVELLRQLLQSGSKENVAEVEAVLNDSDLLEKQAVVAESEEEAETETEIEDETEMAKKQTTKSFSNFRRLISRKLLKLSYPILFCGLAFSLIYLSRKE
ncbi:uncharacterized protein LOC108033423 [Drosophila biarmipes]|uniref:uncharacterized protein LOC108033423 n=1 Tax=Drosophila biarmipes TaxID=125945 RepID=UPI0007E6DA18|nr:uncharacterized protein LOC108033423 [Drosophila biarmipes]XP_050740756.1 uncharacterized protein LOC108033423 [Drosophila biarmipes]